MHILAIDLGKYKSVACHFDVLTQTAEYEVVYTSMDSMRKLLQERTAAVVIIEACLLSGWVHDIARSLGLNIIVANTNEEAWRWRNVKRKTDRDDALKLARLYQLQELTAVHVPDKETREHHQLVKYRKVLVGRVTRVKNHLRAVLNVRGYKAPSGHKAWTGEGITTLQSYAKPLAECGVDELWRGELQLELQQYEELEEHLARVEQRLNELGKQDRRVQLLETIPGVGRRSAEVIATVLDDPKRFANARAVSAYAGLVPKQYQSGQTNRLGRITRRGPSWLRAALVEVAWAMLRYNPWAVGVYERLCREHKGRKKQAIVALARKLLVRCWAMLRDGQPWDENKGKRAAVVS